ncbi:1-aminocyclopropane-1-carboxylate synthase [Pyrenochaeta sp. DS3sAY3a]|nr:1-aminocyclopropane-1-carboxylate synthase [Pyrenochaeta sp. DS3sAY3a]
MSDANCISSRALNYVPQAPLFFDVLDDLWDPESNPDGIVNLGLAENSLMQLELNEFLNSNFRASPHALTYGDGFTGSKRLKHAMCRFLNENFKPVLPLQPAHLFVTPGVGNALECCAWSLFDPGDNVLVGRPYWSAFNYIFKIRAQVDVREVSFGAIDPFSLEAVWEFEKEFNLATANSKVVKAILLCSPHNPLGRCYSEEVLKAYMRLCDKLDLHLISDEIYGLSVFENPEMQDSVPFTSVLSLSAEGLMDPRKVHMQWGLSKDFGATGLRIGCLVSQFNPLFMKSLESFSLFNFPSSLADGVIACLLSNEAYTQRYVSTYRKRLAESYAHTTKFCREHGIPYKEANAALFLMINLGAVVQDKTLTDHDISAILRTKKVYITAGSGYRTEHPGWFRVVIAHSMPVLDEGLNRIVQALLPRPVAILEPAPIGATR